MKLRKKEKRIFGFIGLVGILSGVVLYIFAQFIRVTTQIGEERHPAEHGLRIFHTLATYFLVLILGYLVKSHILPGLRSRKRRRRISGIFTVFLAGFLVLSSLVTLYGGDDSRAVLITKLHVYVGLSIPIILLFHMTQKFSRNG